MSPLTVRDTNAQPASNPTQMTEAGKTQGDKVQQENAPQSHKQVLDNKKAESNGSGTYISPSDAIMSPASKKLSSFKQRQINKQNGSDSTRRALFARTMSANSEKGLEGSAEGTK